MRLSQARVRQALNKWKPILGISPVYKFYVQINNEPNANVKPSKRKDVEASCSVDEAYWNVRLTLNAYEFEPKDFEYVLVHELLHVVLARTERLIRDCYGKRHKKTAVNLLESNVEQLAQAFMYVKTGKRP